MVARFDFRGVPREHVSRNILWLVLNGREVDLCLTDHGYEVDLVVSADLAALTRVWMGDLPLAEAQRLGPVTLAGPREPARQFPGWLGLSLFAPVAWPPRPAVRQPRARASHDPPAR